MLPGCCCPSARAVAVPQRAATADPVSPWFVSGHIALLGTVDEISVPCVALKDTGCKGGTCSVQSLMCANRYSSQSKYFAFIWRRGSGTICLHQRYVC